jgi:glycosyltransferase involved in cell wall biosynthesis
MTRVALVIGKWYPQTGGGIVHVDELASRLTTDHGCEVEIFTKWTAPDNERQVPDEVRLTQIAGTDTSYRLLNELRYTRGVVDQIRTKEFDIVHAHTNTATFPLQIVRLLDDAKTVLTVHGADLDLSVTFTGSKLDYLYTAVRRTILERFRYDGVISVSNELANVLSQHHGTVQYIPNGVDIDAFPGPSGYGNKELLFVGRLRPKKNPTDIVESMQYVTEIHPTAQLHIVGEGPFQNEVIQAVQRLNLEDNVTVHGFVDDAELKHLYEQCSLFVLPSDWEGHPLVLMEAWASGQLVVGTDVAGIREFVTEGFGELIPLNDPEALGKTISNLLQNPDALERHGSDARNFVDAQYSWDVTVKETYNLYAELLNNNGEALTQQLSSPYERTKSMRR